MQKIFPKNKTIFREKKLKKEKNNFFANTTFFFGFFHDITIVPMTCVCIYKVDAQNVDFELQRVLGLNIVFQTI